MFRVDGAILLLTEIFNTLFNLSRLNQKKAPPNCQTENVKITHLNLIQTLYFKFLLNKICQNDTLYI